MTDSPPLPPDPGSTPAPPPAATAGPASDVVRVGHVRGVTLAKWRGIWAERFTATLDVVEVADADQVRVLHEGEVDLCFVRLPIDRSGLHAIPLYDDLMVAWVKKDHVFAAVDEVQVADLEDETVLTELDGVAMDLVLGGAVLVVPMSIARGTSRRDLVYRPIGDHEPSPVALAWRVDNAGPLIEDFIGVVRGRTSNSSRGKSEPSATPRDASPPGSPPRQGAGAGRRGGQGRGVAPGSKRTARGKGGPRHGGTSRRGRR